MIQFSKLRLHGFKSFVERTELEIGPGLTGIVGPNGCGKSNLVEALRWSMGENSSKRMRGGSGSMEDVIFNGTARRPARQNAEVSVLLDNSMKTAPSPYNDCEEVEVVRKIRRDQGSSYHINGKPVRARDVQLLYADILSGANSPYLVSQGKVTTMIQAKPHERRMLLEEAAGISGLYARRHEAELRLRATDTNLKRLDDLVGTHEARFQALKRQARQAARYRNLSAQIRQLDVMIAGLEWRTAHEKLQDVEQRFAEADKRVAEEMTVVTQLTRTESTQSMDLPDLRTKDAEFSARLQTQKLALQRLEDEERRLTDQIEETDEQLSQIGTDRTHEQQALSDYGGVLERLDEEEKAITSSQEKEERQLAEKEKEKAQLEEKVQALENVYTTKMEEFAQVRASRQSLEQQISQDENKLEQLGTRIDSLKERLQACQSEQNENDRVPVLRKDIEALETVAAKLRTELEELGAAYGIINEQYDAQRNVVQDCRDRKAKLDSEIETIRSVLEMYNEEDFKPILEEIQTESGFETALSRALGDALSASTNENAPVVWQPRKYTPDALPALPDGAQKLAAHIKAPDILRPALSQIGIVKSKEDGDRIAQYLKPGQSLVSREGAYWRWDGLYIKEGANDSRAVQLQQKNKLAALEKQRPDTEKNLADALEKQGQIEARQTDTREKREKVQSTLTDTENKIRSLRIELGELVESQAGMKAELAKAEEALSLASLNREEVEKALAENKNALGRYDEKSLEAQQEDINKARETLNETRQDMNEAIRSYDMAIQEQRRRKVRLRAIGDERVNLNNRSIRAREKMKELDEREKSLKEKRKTLAGRPEEIRKESAVLLDRISKMEEEKSVVSDKLATLEAELAETVKALKQAESQLSKAREDRAHAQATTSERQQKLREMQAHIEEKFEMRPEALLAQAAMDEEQMPNLNDLRGQREKAVRDRDMIGPVNLRAEVEAEELEKELGTILSERNDLMEAVNELRAAIQKLNREARERLQIAFDHVNGHFREMFTRLFAGGKAHLALIESDDPLEAGLEIFAEPPGKTLQSLSLLSGGEQTLTAIALIFAMFLTNPAPICVMDEVDAPLDDANVDRFCDLLEEFAEKGKTRFLLITHHRLSMARMDRLYGVTMSERGVSQLVSVDMNQQLDFLDEAA